MELTKSNLQALESAGVIPPGTPPAQVAIFAEASRQHGLSPFKKEIYLTRYRTRDGDKYAIIVGIDGFRIKAAQTGQLAGCDDIKYNLKNDGSFLTAADIKESGKLPLTATATVYRVIAGVRCPFTHTAVFSEFYPNIVSGKDFSKAAQMPLQMIAKCAEAFALKKGFSDELSGLNIEEERQAFEGPQVQTISMDQIDVEAKVKSITSVAELGALWKELNAPDLYIDLFAQRKKELIK